MSMDHSTLISSQLKDEMGVWLPNFIISFLVHHTIEIHLAPSPLPPPHDTHPSLHRAWFNSSIRRCNFLKRFPNLFSLLLYLAI